MKIGVIILVYNEELHIKRCLESVAKISNDIFVVDSYSKDKTISILEKMDICYRSRAWVNYADQFQWAIDNFPFATDWLMRIDADEFLSKELVSSINSLSDKDVLGYNALYVNRKVVFNGRAITYGGYYPVELLRFWRKDMGSIEDRWMDEHIVVTNEKPYKLKGDIVDENLNTFSWWVQKHNGYASREAMDYFIHKLELSEENIILKKGRRSTEIKRRFKDGVYDQLPLFLRALMYFFYRYFIRFGFLDGIQGFIWHFMQGLWYRMLVDVKIWRVNRLTDKGISIRDAIKNELNLKMK